MEHEQVEKCDSDHFGLTPAVTHHTEFEQALEIHSVDISH